MKDNGDTDHKVIAVPAGDPRWAEIHDVDDSTPPRQEIEHFFEVYKMLEGSTTTVLGWRQPSEAADVITKARAAYSAG